MNIARTSLILFFLGTTPVWCAPIERSADDAGTVYLGAITDRDWGRPVAAGDLDGDGWDDVIVSASEVFGGVTSRVYIVRGGPDAAQRGIVDLLIVGADVTIIGAALNDNLGSSIAIGDVNGDGFNDLLICASGADFAGRSVAGVAYIIYGGPTFFSQTTRNMALGSDWDVQIGGPVVGGDMGGSLFFGGGDAEAAAIGNLNGDTFGDIVLGVHLADGSSGTAGRVYVVLGQAFASGTVLSLAVGADFDTVIFGRGFLDELGEIVLTGDLTGDGLDELIMPNRNYSQAVLAAEGAVLIVRGRGVWPSQINFATTSADITLLGVNSFDNLGEDATVGDFNNDSIMDLATAAPGANVGPPDNNINDGFVYGLLGSNSLQVGTITVDYATATPAFLIRGETNEGLGAQLAAGDFNGDGFDDIAAAQRFGGPQINGSIDVVFGRSFVAGETFQAGVDTDVRILGAPQDRIGFSLSVSDVDSNGVDEVFFGTPFNNGPFSNAAGTAYVFSLVDGDFDANGFVDLRDYARFQECASTPIIPTPPTDACYVFDFLADQVLDESDTPEFAARLDGP